MLKNVKKIRNFGIYENHDNVNCDDFSKFNLVYGWNGAGKTTLTKLFRCIEKKNILDCGYPTVEFEIEYNDADGIKYINEQNIRNSSLNIFTFNSDFVKDNIDWDSSVNSILLIDKNKIDDRHKLDELKLLYKSVKSKLDSDVMLKNSLDTDMQSFLTKAARNIKTSLQIINTQDRRYLNYNRTTLSTLINSKRENIFNSDSLLQDKELASFTRAALPIEMPVINLNLPLLDIADFFKNYTQINNILKKSTTSNVINALRENPSMQSWVEHGLTLYKKDPSETCGFCGGNITSQQIHKLENHFNDAFKAFKKEIFDSFRFCDSITHGGLPSKNVIFSELQDSYVSFEGQLKSTGDDINKLLDEWRNILSMKNENPFDSTLEIKKIPLEFLDKYNSILSGVNILIEEHNHKSLNFSRETTVIKDRLEIHYASRELIDYEYDKKEQQKKELVDRVDKILSQEKSLRGEIDVLEASLSDESIAANVFNDELHRFLGRKEISLSFDTTKKGYRIVRNGSEKHAKNLSEGEKTAIAFVYFAIKVDEGDNDITQSVIVVDDPVSSFDSNHLFHSYAFLKKKFESSKQLFVLTHSFSYFKLVRDWFLKKNKRDNVKSKIYIIETYLDGVRKSKITNASSNLIDYNSEYHYLYSRLRHFKDKAHLELDEVYLCANLSRKLLETFLSFKFPKKRSNFKALVDDSVKGMADINSDEVEKLYRFINKYSHNQEIDMGDNTDNLLGESPAIIKYLFTIMKTVDSVHYAEMESLTA